MTQRIDEKKEILTLDKITISDQEATKKANEILQKHQKLMNYLKDK